MFPLVLVHPCSLQLTACHQGTPPTLGLLARRLCSSALHGLHWLWQQNVSWIQKFAALALPGIDPLKSLVQSREGRGSAETPQPSGQVLPAITDELCPVSGCRKRTAPSGEETFCMQDCGERWGKLRGAHLTLMCVSN